MFEDSDSDSSDSSSNSDNSSSTSSSNSSSSSSDSESSPSPSPNPCPSNNNRPSRSELYKFALEQPDLYGIRRSTRTKRDNETLEVPQQLQRRKRRYSSSDDSDYSGSDDQNSFRKGGRYSEAKRKPARQGGKVVSYREDSDDDQTGSDDLIECQYEVEADNGYDTIEKIMTHRYGKVGATGVKTVIYSEERDLNPVGDDCEKEKQYLIKWKNWSHIHNTWESRQTLYEQKANNIKRIELYEKKEEEIRRWKELASIEDTEYFECQLEMMMELQDQYTQVERIVCERAITGDRFRDKSDDSDQPYSSKFEYFIKWCNLSYSACSWEDSNLIKRMFPLAVDLFQKRKHLALPSFKEVKMCHARAQFRKIVEQPEFIAQENSSLRLRDYQLDGLNWLTHAWVKRHGCILADEMGLGKTIQTISLLNVLLKVYNVAGPYLLVVPLSTIMTWQKEFATWAPEMNVLVYLGDQKSRETIRNYEWQHASSRKWKFNALITTYELLWKDKHELGTVQWAVLAVDEAHRLKNDDCQLYKILSSFSTDHRLLITGTPLQNSLRELWSLLHFIMPVKFDDWSEFEEKYSDDSNFFALHRKLEPFLLRRVKKDVEKSLPSKTEQILRVAMTSKQKQYYKWILTKNYEALSKGVKGSITGFINIVMELKKCCNHPYLVRQPDEGMSRESLEAFIKSSGKLILLDKLLLRLREGGHRVLIFSQMVMMLDILAEYLQRRRFAFQRLDGSIKSEQRRQAMEHFNAEGSNDFCFLLSTRAGGLGVNLATADTVIIFDSDWNPQNDLQAQARAHRIGQKKQVSVYRLVTKGSVEEDILERAKKKMVLDHLVIQSMDTTGRAVLSNKQRKDNNPFNKDELSAILKFGAEDLFKEEDEDDDVELDDILRRAETHTTEDHSSGADGLLSQFKVVNFDNLEHEEIERNWDSIIPESQRKKFREEEREKEIRKLHLGPRSRKNVSYKEGKKRDDSASAASDDEVTPKKKRGRVGYFKNMTMSDVRQFIKSFKKFPRPLERLEDIASDGDLKQKNIGDLRKLGERLIEECKDAMTQYDERIKYDPTTENKKTHKGPTITLGSITVKAKQILTSINELEPLAKIVPSDSLEQKRFRLDTKTKAAHWNCEWDVSDDSALLIGVYKKGLGNWEAIKMDADLGLGNKLLPEGDKKPQAKHLQARFEYLSKVLLKLQENAAQGQPETKAKRKKKVNKINKSLKIIVRKEEDKIVSTNAQEIESESVKEKPKDIEENQDGVDNELTEEEFIECKEKMRPVKKALKRLDNSEDQSDLSTAEKVNRAQQLLLEIGDHINEVLKKRSDPDRIKIRANLWKFVSKFTDKQPSKLYKMYKHSIKRRREKDQLNGKSEKSRIENPVSSPSYNQQKSAYSRPPEFKHIPPSSSSWSGKSTHERWRRSSHSSNYKDRKRHLQNNSSYHRQKEARRTPPSWHNS